MYRQENSTQSSTGPQNSRPSLDSADIVIIGNGIAGLTASVEARRRDPDARIVIVTDQNHPTINTPALKQFAVGKVSREQLLAYPVGTERSNRIHLINGHVDEIHAQRKFIALKGGRTLGYGSLLIATGSSPMGLPANIPGRDFDGVLTLHRLTDYLDLRRRLGEVEDAVVIGGGVHAIETVMGLMHCGIKAHWLIRGETFLGKMLDQPASKMVLEHVRRSGVMVYTSTEVVGVVGRIGAVVGVVTNHNQMIPCQLVLSCTGTQPVSTLARQCTVPILQKKGIIVNDKLRTSVRDIYAAGDVAALLNPQTGEYEPRALWYHAVLQGRLAGAMMTGREPDKADPFGVPWHATHLGEISMLTVGDPLNSSEGIMTLTDSNKASYRRMSISGDRLVGYLALGTAPQDSLAIKRIIDEGLSIRSVKKELLKGTFDARRYFSHKRTHATQGAIKTGRLPETSLFDLPAAPKQLQLPAPGSRNTQRLQTTDALQSLEQNDYSESRRHTDDLQLPQKSLRLSPDMMLRQRAEAEWEGSSSGYRLHTNPRLVEARASEYVDVDEGEPIQRHEGKRNLWTYAENGEQ